MEQTPKWEDHLSGIDKTPIVKVCPDPCGRTYETHTTNPQPICQWCMKQLHDAFWKIWEEENGTN